VIAAVVAVVALGIGSAHPAGPGAATRIARLDSVIKCPSCVDLSIAQSDAPIAVGLRAEVAAWVHEGLSDARIEQLVVARFGEQALLVPSGSGADLLLWVLPVSVVGTAAVLLGIYLWRRRRLEEAT
jgi:cytochrome c-type biogenesis protein CcmH